jgi:ribosomal protein S18 acetylase RimI-like enzyme
VSSSARAKNRSGRGERGVLSHPSHRQAHQGAPSAATAAAAVTSHPDDNPLRQSSGRGEPAGLVLCHEYETPEDADEGRDLHVALVGTLRAYRKRGIASALLVRAMTKGRAAGYATASLGVDADSLTGAVGVYEQVGFAIEHTSITQAKPLLPGAPRKR